MAGLFDPIRRQFLLGKARVRKTVEDHGLRDPAAWQARHPLAPPADDPLVRFVIPLIPRAKAHDWENVCRNLNRTLAALRRQSSPDWIAFVACQDVPDGVVFDDQVRFLPIPIAAAAASVSDKTPKQRALIRAASEADHRDGYLFFLDADDIPHPKLVEHIVTDNNGRGYTLTQGLMVDFDARKIVPYGVPPNADTLFRSINGSSTALRFDMRETKAHVGPAFARGRHGITHENAAKFGMQLEPVPFPAMLYVFNHGDNLQLHRNSAEPKERALATATTTEAEFDAVVRTFQLAESDLY